MDILLIIYLASVVLSILSFILFMFQVKTIAKARGYKPKPKENSKIFGLFLMLIHSAIPVWNIIIMSSMIFHFEEVQRKVLIKSFMKAEEEQ